MKSRMRSGGLLMLTALTWAVLPAQARDWTVYVDGAGPLKIGMRYATVQHILGQPLEPLPTLPHSGPLCADLPVPGEPGVLLMFIGDVLKRVDVVQAGVQSDRGIAIGDPADKVQRIYGEAVRVTPNFYDARERYLTVEAGEGQYAIRFETSDGKISGFYAGAIEQVRYVEGCL